MTTNLTLKNDQSSCEKIKNIWSNKNDQTGLDNSSTIKLHFLCSTIGRSNIENSPPKSLKTTEIKRGNWEKEKIGKKFTLPNYSLIK